MSYSLFATVAVGTLALLPIFSEPLFGRTWTNSDGVQIEAELVEILENSVVLKMGYEEYTVPLDKLSAADQAWVAEQRELREEASAAPDADDEEEAARELRLRSSLVSNSDFRSAAGWRGGRLITVNEGTPDEFNALEVRLDRREVTDVIQEFRVPPGVRSCRVVLTYKTSPDFQQVSTAGGGLAAHFGTRRQYYNIIVGLPASKDTWREIAVSFDGLQERESTEFMLQFQPGVGSVYLKSVYLDPVYPTPL